jgi:DNA polymerase-3 subunit epsilon
VKAWPYPGRVAIREHHEESGRTDIHVFDHWCHLATVHDEAELQELSGNRDSLAFDLDTYRMLLKRIRTGSGPTENFFILDAPRAGTSHAPH